MSNFLEILGDLFSGLFGGGPETQKRREIRRLEEQLALIQPPIYQKSSKKILPAYPAAFLQLAKTLAPFQDLLHRTVDHPDPKAAETYRHYLLENLLEGDITTRRAQLGFEALKARFLESSDLSSEITTVNAEFQKLVATVKGQSSSVSTLPYQRLQRLAEWLHHPLDSFLGLFGPNPESPASWQPIEAETALQALLDLYYVHRPLILDEHLESALAILFERLSPQKVSENLAAAKKVLTRARTLVGGLLRPEILETLIRVIQGNPAYHPEFARTEKDVIDAYLEAITERFERDRDRAASEAQESGLGRIIAELFGDRPLLESESYNSLRNDQLVNLGLSALKLVKPLSIVKSFQTYHLDPLILNAYERVITNAIFVEKGWGTQMSNAYYQARGLAERLAELDRNLASGTGRAGFAQLDKLIGRGVHPNVLAPANRIIEAINRSVDAFLQNEAKALHQLESFIQEVLQDYKRPTPERISNIRVLGDKRNREILQDLTQGAENIDKLFKVLKVFIPVTFLGKRGPSTEGE